MNIAAVIKMHLNKDSLELDLFEYWDEAFASLPVQMFKYKRWDWAVDKGVPHAVKPLLELMLSKMQTLDKSNLNWVVDYKVRDLKAGDCGCPIDTWHLDVVENPWHNSSPDLHLIYSTVVGTDFLTQPIPYSNEDNHFNKCLEPFGLDVLESDVIQAKENTVSFYNRFQLHRGPIVSQDCKRMLLRLTATEVIQ